MARLRSIAALAGWVPMFGMAAAALMITGYPERTLAQGAPPTVAEIQATARAIGQYKRLVATKIVSANPQQQSKSPYRTIAVVGYTVNQTGEVSQTWIVRSSGEEKIDNAALASFQKALPLPKPNLELFGTDTEASLAEAFIFAQDLTWKMQTLLK